MVWASVVYVDGLIGSLRHENGLRLRVSSVLLQTQSCVRRIFLQFDNLKCLFIVKDLPCSTCGTFTADTLSHRASFGDSSSRLQLLPLTAVVNIDSRDQ